MAGPNDSKTDDVNPEALLKSLIEETEPMLPMGFAAEVEKDLGAKGRFGIIRALALAYLEKPFGETLELAKTSRDFAVGSAHVADVLQGAIQSHESLVGWLRAAQVRMTFAVAAAREDDYDAVIAEARADAVKAQNKLLKLVVDNSEKP